MLDVKLINVRTAFITDIMVQFAFSRHIFAKISKSTFGDLTPSSTKVFNFLLKTSGQQFCDSQRISSEIDWKTLKTLN